MVKLIPMNDLRWTTRQEADFWSHVKHVDSGCWEWQGCISGNEYGNARFSGKSYRAHRLSWLFKHRMINDSLLVCHRCDNSICVNPDHLFQGTTTDNLHDAIRKGRRLNPEQCRQISKLVRMHHANSEWRKRHSVILMQRMQDPATRERMSVSAKRRCADPAWRRNKSEKIKQLFRTPKYHELLSRAAKNRCDAVWCRKSSERLRTWAATSAGKQHYRRLANMKKERARQRRLETASR